MVWKAQGRAPRGDFLLSVSGMIIEDYTGDFKTRMNKLNSVLNGRII